MLHFQNHSFSLVLVLGVLDIVTPVDPLQQNAEEKHTEVGKGSKQNYLEKGPFWARVFVFVYFYAGESHRR